MVTFLAIVFGLLFVLLFALAYSASAHAQPRLARRSRVVRGFVGAVLLSLPAWLSVLVVMWAQRDRIGRAFIAGMLGEPIYLEDDPYAPAHGTAGGCVSCAG